LTAVLSLAGVDFVLCGCMLRNFGVS